MTEKVVYLLGAGFSAPLGLPVMNNFLFKSRDQYFADPEKYGYFADVFDLIRKLADVKNYFTADLFNIEEVLSILEMKRHLASNEAAAHDYIRYLCDVIEFYTPDFKTNYGQEINWFQTWLGNERINRFGKFVACLFNLEVEDRRGESRAHRLSASRQEKPKTRYSVVTLNYDLVLEKLCEQIASSTNCAIAFCTDQAIDDRWEGTPHLAKLHGTVESKNVVPPTWNKGLHHGIAEVWGQAYKILSTATQIRVVGYSLPETDSYVKYLLKSAVTESRNLKQIDVICLDAQGEVRTRYDKFVDFPRYRFASLDVLSYLDHQFPSEQLRIPVARFDFLEQLHARVSWQ